MWLLPSTLRHRIQILLGTGVVAAAGVVAGPAIAAHAQDCIGSSCNGLNSNAEGCASDAVSRSAPQTFWSTAAGEQLAIQLRGSPSCESRWARVWAINGSGSQLPPPSGVQFTIYSDNAAWQVVYAQTATVGSSGWESYPYWVGPMVSGVALYSRVCFPSGVCTSWWPSAPPGQPEHVNYNCSCVTFVRDVLAAQGVMLDGGPATAGQYQEKWMDTHGWHRVIPPNNGTIPDGGEPMVAVWDDNQHGAGPDGHMAIVVTAWSREHLGASGRSPWYNYSTKMWNITVLQDDWSTDPQPCTPAQHLFDSPPWGNLYGVNFYVPDD